MAAFLQRIAIVQIVPEAAQQDEEFDAQTLTPLRAGDFAPKMCSSTIRSRSRGRRDLAMAPEPRLGFEMTLLRMLAFRPGCRGADHGGAGRALGAAGSAPVPAPRRRARSRRRGGRAGRGTRRGTRRRCGCATASMPRNWPAVVEAASLSGMVRQFALELRAGLIRARRADAASSIKRRRIGARAPSRRSSLQGLSKYLGRDIRIIFETAQTALATPARQRALAEQDKAVRAAAAFEADPAVKGLRERFGAEVDAASVKPAN